MAIAWSLRYRNSIQRLRSVWCCSLIIATVSHSPLRKGRYALWSLMRSGMPAGHGRCNRVLYAAPRYLPIAAVAPCWEPGIPDRQNGYETPD